MATTPADIPGPGPAFQHMKLIPWQEEVERAINQGAKNVYIKAGRKSGKSQYAMYRMVKDAMEPSHLSDEICPIIGPERIHTKKIFWMRLKEYVCPERKWENVLSRRCNETELYMDFKGGKRLILEGAENEKILRGRNFGSVVLDEADEMRAMFYDEVVEPNTLLTDGVTIFIGTPKNRWFTKRWRLAKAGKLGAESAAFQFTPYDNPFIAKEKLEIIKRQKSREVWEQEYMANENFATGTKYHEFDESQIVPHREPTGDKFCRFVDWGWDHYTVCLWAEIWFNHETKRWNVYIFNELLLRGRDVQEIVLAIKSGDSRRYLLNIIDKSSRRTELSSGSSILNEFRRHGFACVPSLRNEDYQVNALKMMLKTKDIQISERCLTLIKQLREVEWDTKEGDDALDALKYGAAIVYDRDFSHIDSMEGFDKEIKKEEDVDPYGLIAAKQERNEGMWEVVNW